MGIEEIEEIGRLHHKNCYNKEKFKWEWQDVHCIGIWASGGCGDTPKFQSVHLRTPPENQVAAWWCYIGPIPEFEE